MDIAAYEVIDRLRAEIAQLYPKITQLELENKHLREALRLAKRDLQKAINEIDCELGVRLIARKAENLA